MVKSVADIFRSYAVFEGGRHVNGTDKQSNHNYGDAYERIFSVPDYANNLCPYPIGSNSRSCDKCGSDTSHFVACPDFKRQSKRDDVKLMLEIGIADGSSLLAWSEVFPNAHVIGMDIHYPAKIHGHRLEYRHGDQRLKEDCDRVANGAQFDFICEDATHLLANSLLTLLYLWPYVAPGGIYVIEEFDNIGALRQNVTALWPNAEIIDTQGPFGGVESLVVMRKR